jgi:hypothetical protein
LLKVQIARSEIALFVTPKSTEGRLRDIRLRIYQNFSDEKAREAKQRHDDLSSAIISKSPRFAGEKVWHRRMLDGERSAL